LLSEYGSDAVREMPRNNKGFDICVVTADGELHVEVKGTRSPEPVFLMTQAELLHSQQAPSYRLIVVHAIDLAAGRRRTVSHHGPIAPDVLGLRPMQWAGSLRSVG
jgi:hypothetical protein